MSDGKRNGIEATGRQPCPICGRHSWCLLFQDGGVSCYRADGPGSLERQDKQGNLYWAHPADADRPKPEAHYQEFQPSRAEDAKLDRVYQECSSQLSLSDEHRAQLLARGLSEVAIRAHDFRTMHPAATVRAAIAKSLAERFPAFWQSVPGLLLNQNGQPRLAASGGLCIFGRNLEGQIVAIQIRRDQVEDGGSRYRWFSSAKHGGPGPGAPATFWKPIGVPQVPDVVRICEGAFKAVLAAQATGVPGIAAGAGVGSMASKQIEEMLRQLKPARVIFCPDQNAHTQPQVARQVNVCLGRMLWLRQDLGFDLAVETWGADLPADQRPDGVDDALAAGLAIVTEDPEAYRRRLPFVDGPDMGQQGDPLENHDQPEPEDEQTWEQPLPLEETVAKPVFPINSLPGLAREFALAIAEAYQVPNSYAASLVLGATSTALLKRVVVDCGRGSVTALNEWFLTVLESGSGKSSGLHVAFAPIYAYERLAVDRAEVPEGTTNEVGLVSSDPTPEALEKRLRANDGRFAVANPEAADLFAILAGKYTANGSGANIGLFLKGYSGDTHRSDRVLRGATYIFEPRISLALALQPSAFEAMCSSGEFQQRGLMARFLLDTPDSLLGYRKLDPNPVSKSLKEQWNSLLSYLLSFDPPRDDAKEPIPFRLNLSPQANTVLREFRSWAEVGLRPEGFWERCREFGARATEHVIKLAGLLHCLQHPGAPWEQAVTQVTMVAATDIFGYFAEHVRLASGSASERRKTVRLDYLLERIRSKTEWRKSFRARDLLVLVKKRKGFENIEILTKDLDQLCQLGYLRSTIVKRGRPSLVYLVSPWVFSEPDPHNLQPAAKPFGINLKSVGASASENGSVTHKGLPSSQAASTIVGKAMQPNSSPVASQSQEPQSFAPTVGSVGHFPVVNAPQFVDLPEMF